MALSPMMRQYLDIKRENSDCVVLFRLGDFYEMFFNDAIEISKALELTLTGRDCGLDERAPMCGVPYHALDQYLARLVALGYRAAICEQITEPGDQKGLVERAVTRIVTPGTVIEPNMLEEKGNNYILCAYLAEGRFGLCYADVSTGECYCEQADDAKALDEALSRVRPTEVLANEAAMFRLTGMGIRPRAVEGSGGLKKARAAISRRIGENGAFVLDEPCMALSADALFLYLDRTQKNALAHLSRISPGSGRQHMLIDETARRNLELTRSLTDPRSRAGTLFALLDRTATSMGARQLRQFIENPLYDLQQINSRLDAVAELSSAYSTALKLKEALAAVYDVERLIARISYGSLNARDCLSLLRSFLAAPGIKALLSAIKSDEIEAICADIDTMDDIAGLLSRSISEDAPATVREGGVIKAGFSPEVDELRDAAHGGRQWIAKLEENERAQTGIKNLKVGYNRVFGYYIEVTKSQLSEVPYRYTRRQTLANAERFITRELKEIEETVLGAQDKLQRLEYSLFMQICDTLSNAIPRMQRTARALKRIDALNSLALCAAEYGYVRPEVHEGYGTEIDEGRHPVVERLGAEPFVPNDTLLSDGERLMVVTGPNMAGKSTYLRQVALITLMAHAGSFVPAARAKIALTDRIFTRIGAQDNLAAGQSTFMVEMSEMSHILRHATRRSLLVLDEIGRGTSTFDGLAIAWAVVEHIASASTLGAKTLFATHYHELSELEGRLDGVVNYCSAVRERGDEVIFLRRVVRGGADRSFGVQVAQMAGLPASVVARAREVMARLEASHISHERIGSTLLNEPEGGKGQVDLTSYPYIELCHELAGLDVNAMTPVDALNALYRLRERAKLI